MLRRDIKNKEETITDKDKKLHEYKYKINDL